MYICTSVLESIYQILQSSTNSTFSARFSRVVRREEILGRIEEQDRRLDTSITSFQVSGWFVTLKARTLTQVYRLSSSHR
jgi:hypothetical protein